MYVCMYGRIGLSEIVFYPYTALQNIVLLYCTFSTLVFTLLNSIPTVFSLLLIQIDIAPSCCFIFFLCSMALQEVCYFTFMMFFFQDTHKNIHRLPFPPKNMRSLLTMGMNICRCSCFSRI